MIKNTDKMINKPTIALIAHDKKKKDLVEFILSHKSVLKEFDIVATGTTGQQILKACPELHVARMKSGPLGGDQQIGGFIAEKKINILIFFVDPLTLMPHDVDVKALMRLAVLYDIPMALNRSTAEKLLTKDN